jgi:hypothetical protein
MRHIYKISFAVLIIGLFIFWPGSSYADWNNHSNSGNSHVSGNSHSSGSGNNGHGHDGHGHDRGHSYIGVNFSFWPDTYYYNTPYYPPDDVLVAPNVYQPVVVNGETYYMNNGAYYAYTSYGYQAIAPPVTVVQPPVVIDNQAQPAGPVITTVGSTANTSDSFTINIPNNKGGYTAVTLKRSGNGYIGPQGEFYQEFPKVSQLEVMYGK